MTTCRGAGSTNPNESFQTTENNTEGSKAESVMIAGLFVVYGKEYVKLSKRIGNDAEAERAQAEVDKMIAGPAVYICDKCVFLSAGIIVEECDESNGANNDTVQLLENLRDIKKIDNTGVFSFSSSSIACFDNGTV